VTRLPKTIVIVGAGFSGAAVAINLLRLSYWRPVRIVLVDRSPRMARGAAYAERSHPHLLNVPAGRMSMNSADALEFLKFAQQRFPAATAEDFLPRSLYGDYLESVLLDAEISSPQHVQLHKVVGTVFSIERTRSTSPYRVELDDGTSFVADDVVLALGNPPPANIAGTSSLVGSSHYVSDPWASPPALEPNETVLVIGTGLTMADTVIAGNESSWGRATFHAISRHGMIPPTQTAFRTSAGCDSDDVTRLRAHSSSARGLLRAVRELTTDVQARGGDWREAITCVRNQAPMLWQRLPHRERKRFLRHARAYWDVHRHRLPQQTLSTLRELQRDGKLHVHAGRIQNFELEGKKVRVTWRPRGSDAPQTILVDRVFNCTGADYNLARTRDPLWRSLLSQGLAAPDELGLGLRTGAYGAVLDSRNRISSNLYYIGPMLRADHWECTAAQELRVHAERLAHHLAAPAVKPMLADRRTQPILTTSRFEDQRLAR
jgi:uncharacterized NAD(P)/FAD-binding protein YdhS